MTVEEFSNEFDIYYDNAMSNQAPGLDNYDKSVFLTQAQNSVVSSIYKGDLVTEGFENTEIIKNSLSNLIKTTNPPLYTGTISNNHIVDNSILYTIPNNLWYSIYEEAKISSIVPGNITSKKVLVTPIMHDTFYKIYNNPFEGANSNRVLKLTKSEYQVELIPQKGLTIDNNSYLIRYLQKPDPIILSNLHDINSTLQIDGNFEPSTCKLNSILHRVILIKAVELAKAIWSSPNSANS